MTADQARAAADAMIALWQGEFAATVRVLAAVKDETRDYTPHPRSRTAWQLATHIATADIWFMDSIRRGEFQWNPDAAQRAQEKFSSVRDVVQFYETTFPAKLAELSAMPAEQLAEPLDFFGVRTLPRATWIGAATNHSIHHRGQLSAYLRGLGAKVPDIYGPSADAEVPAS